MARKSEVYLRNVAWFKDEFGAKKNIEIAPKLKSGRGFAKAKIVVSDKPGRRFLRQGSHQHLRGSRDPDHHRCQGRPVQDQANRALWSLRPRSRPGWRAPAEPIPWCQDPKICCFRQPVWHHHPRCPLPPGQRCPEQVQIPVRAGFQAGPSQRQNPGRC